jgi:hypothetical protein
MLQQMLQMPDIEVRNAQGPDFASTACRFHGLPRFQPCLLVGWIGCRILRAAWPVDEHQVDVRGACTETMNTAARLMHSRGPSFCTQMSYADGDLQRMHLQQLCAPS